MELTVIHLSCSIISLKDEQEGLVQLFAELCHYITCASDMSQPYHIGLRWISGIHIEILMPVGRTYLPYFQQRRSSGSGGTVLPGANSGN